MAQFNPKRRTLVNVRETVAGWLEWRSMTTAMGRGSHKGAYISSLLEADRDAWLVTATPEEREAYVAYLKSMGLDTELALVSEA